MVCFHWVSQSRNSVPSAQCKAPFLLSRHRYQPWWQPPFVWRFGIREALCLSGPVDTVPLQFLHNVKPGQMDGWGTPKGREWWIIANDGTQCCLPLYRERPCNHHTTPKYRVFFSRTQDVGENCYTTLLIFADCTRLCAAHVWYKGRDLGNLFDTNTPFYSGAQSCWVDKRCMPSRASITKPALDLAHENVWGRMLPQTRIPPEMPC